MPDDPYPLSEAFALMLLPLLDGPGVTFKQLAAAFGWAQDRTRAVYLYWLGEGLITEAFVHGLPRVRL